MRGLVLLLAILLVGSTQSFAADQEQLDFDPKQCGLRPDNEEGDNITFQVGNMATRTIVFPKNGKQPTLREAAQNSLANKQSENDEQVTEWYMKAFGCKINDSDQIIKLGVDAGGTPVPIVELDKSYPKKNLLPSFWNTFKAVASNPVGRILLYRILIELRRKKGVEGCQEGGIEVGPQYLKVRNCLRQLTIVFGDPGFSFDQFVESGNSTVRAYLYFTPAVNGFPDPVLSGTQQQLNINSTTHCFTADVGLFHELVHYFHSLRDFGRYSSSRKVTDFSKDTTFGKYMEALNQVDSNNNLHQYIKSSAGALEWFKLKTDGLANDTLCYEEFLAINGNVFWASNNERYKQLEGDDLSENLYRSFAGQPMRWGHRARYKRSSEIKDINEESSRGKIIKYVYDYIVTKRNEITREDTGEWAFEPGKALFIL